MVWRPIFSRFRVYWNHYKRSKLMHCDCVLEPWSAPQLFAFITHAMRCLWTLAIPVPEVFKAHLLSFSDHPALSLTVPDSPGFCYFHTFMRLILPFSLLLRCASRIFLLSRYENPSSTSLSQFVHQTASAFAAPVFAFAQYIWSVY